MSFSVYRAVAVALPFAAAHGSPASATTFRTLHVFSGSDGAYPSAELVQDAAGELYGVTGSGGAHGMGTIFRLSPPPDGHGKWALAVLHDFTTAQHAPTVFSGLLAGNNSTFFGVTSSEVFKLSPPGAGKQAWRYATLYRFGAVAGDASYPSSSLIFGADGALYGASATGGGSGQGAVYRLAKTQSGWAETVIYSFSGADGWSPKGSLALDLSGAIIGTTQNGGIGQGNVYRLTPLAGQTAWQAESLHDFAFSEGHAPVTGVTVDADGVIYGATWETRNKQRGDAYSLTPPEPGGGPWSETVLAPAENFYGRPLKLAGGGFILPVDGAVVSLVQDAGAWTRTRLHGFSVGVTVGALAAGRDGVFYGVTDYGNKNFAGTVYSIQP